MDKRLTKIALSRYTSTRRFQIKSQVLRKSSGITAIMKEHQRGRSSGKNICYITINEQPPHVLSEPCFCIQALSTDNNKQVQISARAPMALNVSSFEHYRAATLLGGYLQQLEKNTIKYSHALEPTF